MKNPVDPVILSKKSRSAYQRKYHAEHLEEAAERKELERYRREKARRYWRTKILLKREMPGLIADVSPEILEQERIKYMALLDEPCEVIHVPAEVVRKRKVTTEEEEEAEEEN
ncbi:MAG TPA: hypothetical protein PKI68_01180 [Pontiellaceae bacterium]|nr:hypothetical protein [Pontiellaceae bacterium]